MLVATSLYVVHLTTRGDAFFLYCVALIRTPLRDLGASSGLAPSQLGQQTSPTDGVRLRERVSPFRWFAVLGLCASSKFLAASRRVSAFRLSAPSSRGARCAPPWGPWHHDGERSTRRVRKSFSIVCNSRFVRHPNSYSACLLSLYSRKTALLPTSTLALMAWRRGSPPFCPESLYKQVGETIVSYVKARRPISATCRRGAPCARRPPTAPPSPPV